MLLIRNVFILTIVSLLLLGSVGIDVFKHICKEDGVTVTLFVEADHHCKEDLQNSCCSGHDEKDCCDDEVQRVQILPDYYNDFFTPEFNLLPIAVVIIRPVIDEPLTSEKNIISNFAKPPPKSGRQILLRKQVWVI